MKLKFTPHTLFLKYPFTLSVGTRISTPIVITEIEHNGIIGYGEASMPPYLGENHETVLNFLSKIDLSSFKNPFEIDFILSEIAQIETGNNAAKTAVDIALHDLVGKILNEPCYKILKIKKEKLPLSSITIGIDSDKKIMQQKIKDAENFKLLKVKLGSEDDKKIIKTICSLTNKPFSVDINQGWKDKYFALDMIFWLQEMGAIFIEQPLPKEKIDEMAWLTESSPLPTIADEAVKRLSDIPQAKNVYDGINIKLMKSTGINEAMKMISLAKSFGMKILIGCMSETSCGISAAAQLAPLCDWADLDSNLLIKNDLFEGMKIVDGRVSLNELAGIGVKKL